MKRRLSFLFACALALAIGAGAPASAQDFSVSVPIQLNNMPPEVTAVIVDCVAVCRSGQGALIGASGEQSFRPTHVSDIPNIKQGSDAVGSGRQVRAINPSTGTLTDTVTVSFSARPNYAPNNVVGYACWMVLRDQFGAEAIPGSENQDHFQFANLQSAEGQFIYNALNYSGYVAGLFNNPALDLTSNDGCQQ